MQHYFGHNTVVGYCNGAERLDALLKNAPFINRDQECALMHALYLHNPELRNRQMCFSSPTKIPCYGPIESGSCTKVHRQFHRRGWRKWFNVTFQQPTYRTTVVRDRHCKGNRDPRSREIRKGRHLWLLWGLLTSSGAVASRWRTFHMLIIARKLICFSGSTRMQKCWSFV